MLRNRFFIFIFILCSCQHPNSWRPSNRVLKLDYIPHSSWKLDKVWYDSSVVWLATLQQTDCTVRLLYFDSLDWERTHRADGDLYLEYMDTLICSYAIDYLRTYRDDAYFFDMDSTSYIRKIDESNNSAKLFYQFERCLFEMEYCDDGWVVFYLMEGTDTTLFKEAKKSIEIIETPL